MLETLTPISPADYSPLRISSWSDEQQNQLCAASVSDPLMCNFWFTEAFRWCHQDPLPEEMSRPNAAMSLACSDQMCRLRDVECTLILCFWQSDQVSGSRLCMTYWCSHTACNSARGWHTKGRREKSKHGSFEAKNASWQSL